MIKIYHNPRCRKSREALQILSESGREFTVVEYIKNPLTMEDISDLLVRLNIKPVHLIRKNEKIFKEEFRGLEFSDEEWIKVLSEQPKLIERPIVVNGHKAVIARPPEKVRDVL
ncbi:MAG: arsenate reductase (glutaredoxin) [Flavobacteriales bacterium]